MVELRSAASSEEEEVSPRAAKPAVDEGVVEAGTSRTRKGKDRGKQSAEPTFGPESIISRVLPTHDLFGEEVINVARGGFALRCPEPNDRVCFPREREVGFYLPCVTDLGLRFPMPPLFLVVLHALRIPLHLVTPNSVANMVGFIILCGRCKIDPSFRLLRYFFHMVTFEERYYTFQARRGRKLLGGLSSKVRDWKYYFAFVVTPEGAALPGPAVLDVDREIWDWMNEDPKDILSSNERKWIKKLTGVKEEHREINHLLAVDRIERYAWARGKNVMSYVLLLALTLTFLFLAVPEMEEELKGLMAAVAQKAVWESQKRIAMAGRGLTGARGPGVVVRERTPEPAPERESSLPPQQSPPASPRREMPSGSGKKRPPSSPREAAPVEQLMSPRSTGGEPLSKKRKEGEGGSASGGATHSTPATEGGLGPVAQPSSAKTGTWGLPRARVQEPATPSAIELSEFAVTAYLGAVFDEEEKRLQHVSQWARGRMYGKCRELAKALHEAQEATKEQGGADPQKGGLAAAEAKVKELTGQLQSERESQLKKEEVAKKKEADWAAARTGLKKTINSHSERILELEDKVAALKVQVARASELEAKIVFLEDEAARAAKATVHNLEDARASAIAEYRQQVVPQIMSDALAQGSELGRQEGFQVGFYQALKKVVSRHPELQREVASYSVKEALVEADAEVAAELQAEYERSNKQAAASSAVPPNDKGKKKATTTTKAPTGPSSSKRGPAQ